MKLCKKCMNNLRMVAYLHYDEGIGHEDSEVLEDLCEFWSHVALRALEKAFKAYREMNDDMGREVSDRI